MTMKLPEQKNFSIEIFINGLLSSLPYLGKYIMAVCASYLADYLRQSNRMTTTTARKAFTTFAVLPPGLMMIAQIFMGHNRVFAVTIFTIQLTLNGAVTAGYLGNGLDIAPNFSGTIFGLANTLSSLSGFLSNFMVGWLTQKNDVLHVGGQLIDDCEEPKDGSTMD
uniref:Major facilitator superfamily (MFS) profile domain-containing protein n=1 Tax=Phlebotomus papatasi TaxID=29031 RepID=A0A1B0D7V6_PHLPP